MNNRVGFAAFRRFAFLPCGLFLFTVSPDAAKAGSYILVSQTGGQCVNPMRPYKYSRDDVGNTYGSYACIRATGQYGDVNMSGAITTAYKWVPNKIVEESTGNLIDDAADTPPKQVVVQEFCQVTSSNTDPTQDLGKVDNGLHSPVTRYTDISDYGVWSAGQTTYVKGAAGTRCQIKSGGPSITITCSPSLSNSPTAGEWESEIDYRVNVFPITLAVSGITNFNNAHNILIGQCAVGSLYCGVGKFINYHWTISGDTFKSYSANGSYNTPAGGPQVTYLKGNDYTAPLPFWVWKKDESDTVSVSATPCVPTAEMPKSSNSADSTVGSAQEMPVNTTAITATLADPSNGGEPQPSGDPVPPGYSVLGQVSAQETINVMAPYFCFASLKGPLTLNNGACGAGQIDDSGNLILGSKPGMQIGARVQTPKSFYQPSMGLGHDAGFFCFVQLINRTLMYTHAGLDVTKNTGGAYWLDNSAPYGTGGGWSSTAKSSPNGDPYPVDIDDTPSIAFLWDTTYIYVRDIFQDYLMYLPPGEFSQWVPLERMTWGWNVDNQWNFTGWYPNPANQVWETPDTRWTTHPTWSNVFSNTK